MVRFADSGAGGDEGDGVGWEEAQSAASLELDDDSFCPRLQLRGSVLHVLFFLK